MFGLLGTLLFGQMNLLTFYFYPVRPRLVYSRWFLHVLLLFLEVTSLVGSFWISDPDILRFPYEDFAGTRELIHDWLTRRSLQRRMSWVSLLVINCMDITSRQRALFLAVWRLCLEIVVPG